MFDNGILQYYRNLPLKNGYLQIDKNVHENKSVAMDCINSKLYKVDIAEVGSFFAKACPEGLVEAEVLMGQLYTKAGINSAIYLPVYSDKIGQMVVSQDVRDKNGIYAKEYNGEHKFIDVAYLGNDWHSKYSKEKRDKLMSPQASANLLLKRCLDISCRNCDGHSGNITLSLKDGVITDIGSFDYGSCDLISTPETFVFFHNDFCKKYLTKEHFVEQFKNNGEAQAYITPEQVGEIIGNLDVLETARDIKETLGLEIHKTDMFARCFNDMAEELVHI